MYETLGELVVGHGGEIVKYLGDAILSVFPAGREVEAAACGLEMRQAFGGNGGKRGLRSEIELEAGDRGRPRGGGRVRAPDAAAEDVFARK